MHEKAYGCLFTTDASLRMHPNPHAYTHICSHPNSLNTSLYPFAYPISNANFNPLPYPHLYSDP